MGRKAYAVIGVSFGDEGKGRMVDYLVRGLKNPIVVRFNGGGQAGHTVVLPDGRRHVFGHYGAGTFAGCPTLWTRNFIFNPFLFEKEYRALTELCGNLPPIYMLPCMMTTPYDMLINQVLEKSRGTKKHGSCGVGINETVERHLVWPLSFANGNDSIEYFIKKIRDVWVPSRLEELGIELTGIFKSAAESKLIFSNYMDAIKRIRDSGAIKVIYDTSEVPDGDLVFEGAQGLKLDQKRLEFFPYLTRSSTGSREAMLYARELKADSFTTVYVTRWYTTRHGNGPLPHESIHLTFLELPDDTNTVNEWQGRLRYGCLDWDALLKDTTNDLWNAEEVDYHDIANPPILAVTHLDTVYPPNVIPIFKGGQIVNVKDEDLMEMGMKHFSKVITSIGKTHRDTWEYE